MIRGTPVTSDYWVSYWNWWLDSGRPERVCGHQPERAMEHFFPLWWYKRHGIEPGRQWDLLGRLAARYARDYTVAELAAGLKAVMEASDQDMRRPWTWSHARDIAARARRFTDRSDQQQAASAASYLNRSRQPDLQARQAAMMNRWQHRLRSPR